MTQPFFFAALGAALLLGACATGGEAGPARTQLSQCTRAALTGEAVDFPACAWLAPRDTQQIENAYLRALAANAPQQAAWDAPDGARTLSVAAPAPAARAECRTLNAALLHEERGAHALPQETFCRAGEGWRPG